ncbi:N-formylglutamate amidohydrolase [Crenothrix sp.]|uniref:N-formylglutamate amidohydrolase n=1 Tax=Crenothrix sp. TaxID=3100433 RepID=UPI00374D73DC
MILHIPHAGINTLGRNIEKYDIDELTDWYTDKLFHHQAADSLIQDVSRFVCDVERFPDDKESMFLLGQGICYTKGTRNNTIEVIDKEYIINIIYNKWHIELNKKVAFLLCYFPIVVVVDCHSFADKEGYPDFCIGTTEQTPKELVDLVQIFLIGSGYDARINFPYSGAMIPTNYIGNKDVIPIMIEVNKKIYLNSENYFNNTKKVINSLLDVISNYEDKE